MRRGEQRRQSEQQRPAFGQGDSWVISFSRRATLKQQASGGGRPPPEAVSFRFQRMPAPASASGDHWLTGSGSVYCTPPYGPIRKLTL